MSNLVEQLTFVDEEGGNFWGAKIKNPNSEDLIKGLLSVYTALRERMEGDPRVPRDICSMRADMKRIDGEHDVYLVWDPYEKAGTKLTIAQSGWG